MIRRAAFLLVLSCATPIHAQLAANSTDGALLRGLDKVSGQVVDIEIRRGERHSFGRLSVELTECRYPVGNPAGEAFAGLTITEEGRDTAVFNGWMIASSPALSALDHARYDIWVLRCITS